MLDHDHVTGKIRNAVCYSCNMILGSIETAMSKDLLSAFLDYIACHKD